MLQLDRLLIHCEENHGRKKTSMKKWIWFAVVAMAAVVILLALGFGIYGLAADAAISSVLLWTVLNYDRATQFASIIYKTFSKVSFWAEKRSISTYLQSTVNILSRIVNSESKDLVPHGLKIKWIDPHKSRDAFIRDENVVICMESSDNQDRNLARATMLYIAADLVHDSRRYVDEDVMKSADFAVARKMLLIDKRIDALRCLNHEFIEPEIEKKPKIRSYLESMKKMDDQGMLTRILLREFSAFDARIIPQPSNKQAEIETVEFTQVVKRVVDKEKGINVTPTYAGQFIRANIMLVARADALFATGQYVRFAEQSASENVDNLYVSARGGNNIALARLVVKDVEKANLYVTEDESRYRSIVDNSYVDTYLAFLRRK